MADTLQVVVRFLHVLFGATWIGGMILWGHSGAPGLSKTPPSVRGPAMGAIVPRMSKLFLIAGPATILFGVWNQYLIAGGLSYQGSAWHVSLGAALIISLAMVTIGAAVLTPSFKKLQAMAKNAPPQSAGAASPPPEALALQKKIKRASLTNTLLGVVAVLLMVVAVLSRTAPA